MEQAADASRRQIRTDDFRRDVRRPGSDIASLADQHWLKRCDFSRADFRLATLDGSHFTFCDFRGASLRGASARHVSLSGCDLREADLRDVDLTGSRFDYVKTGTDHGRTDVTGARFDGATTTGLRLERVIGWTG